MNKYYVTFDRIIDTPNNGKSATYSWRIMTTDEDLNTEEGLKNLIEFFEKESENKEKPDFIRILNWKKLHDI
jgi:hypothetical protein